MRRKDSRRRKDDSDSQSSSSDYEESIDRPEDLFKELKKSLIENQRSNNVYRLVYKIEKNYKESVGILRVSISGNFNFNHNDMEEFFKKFGKIEKIVLKQTNFKNFQDQQPKAKEADSIGYIIYSEHFSAILALKVLNSISQKQRIITAKIVNSSSHSTNESKLFSEPLIKANQLAQNIITVEKDYQFGDLIKNYKFVGTIGLDLVDKEYKLRYRIAGVDCCNFVRIQYLCEKNFKFQHEGEESRPEDLVLKLVSNSTNGLDREVLILSNSLQKYNQAMRSLHELFEQIVEEYKNGKEKMVQIIPKDIHIKKWEKFNIDTQLKFFTS